MGEGMEVEERVPVGKAGLTWVVCTEQDVNLLGLREEMAVDFQDIQRVRRSERQGFYKMSAARKHTKHRRP